MLDGVGLSHLSTGSFTNATIMPCQIVAENPSVSANQMALMGVDAYTDRYRLVIDFDIAYDYEYESDIDWLSIGYRF